MDLLLEIHLGEPLETESTNLYIMNLQLENQLIQGNQVTFGSPLWRFITLLNEIFYFILVTWITKWRTNCFKGIKQLRFSTVEIHYPSEWYLLYHVSIMDLQMENQLFQGNQEASILYYGSPNGEPTVTRKPSSIRFSMMEIQHRISLFHFIVLDLQMENHLFQVNQKL